MIDQESNAHQVESPKIPVTQPVVHVLHNEVSQSQFPSSALPLVLPATKLSSEECDTFSEDSVAVKMLFSAPKSVDNYEIPETYDSESHSKSHGKTKSWDGNPSPIESLVSNNETSSLAPPNQSPNVPITHYKSKSEDLDQNSKGGVAKLKSNIQFWEMRSRLGPGHTPDLVMDLPMPSESREGGTSPSSSCGSNSPLGDEPNSPENTNSGAECFAMQNQCTLKKNQCGHSSLGGRGGSSSAFGHTSSSSSSSCTSTPVVLEEETESSNEFHHMGSATGSTAPATKSHIHFFENESTKTKKPHVKVKPQVMSKPRVPEQFVHGVNNGANNGSHHNHHLEPECSSSAKSSGTNKNGDKLSTKQND